jgi:hypothetical protein
MGVSLPNTGGEVDFVKLTLFLGDEYVLKEFGRISNHFCEAAMSKIKKRLSTDRGTAVADAMTLMRHNLIELAQRSIADNMGFGKYTSINPKSRYIEFRSAGGEDYFTDIDRLKNTLLRYAQAMTIAGNPAAYRREYYKKLYKLISPKENDPALALFARWSAGELSVDQLKRDWAELSLEKERPKKGPYDDTEWEAVDPDTGEVLATTRDFSITNATNYFRQDLKLARFQVREKEPELVSARAKLAKRIKTLGPGSAVYYKWRIYNPKTGEDNVDWMTRDRVMTAVRRAEANEPKNGKYQATQIGQGSAQLTSPDSAYKDQLSVDFRIKGSNEVIEHKQFDINDGDTVDGSTQPLVRAIAQASELAEKLGKPVVAYETNPVAKDDDQDSEQLQARVDPAVAQVRRDWEFYRAETGAVIDRVTDINMIQANAVRADIVRRYGHPDDSVRMRSVPTEQSAERARARMQGQEQEPNVAQNFTGTWRVLNANTGEEVYRFGGSTNTNQGDANRVAAQWVRQSGYDDPVEVVPEQR